MPKPMKTLLSFLAALFLLALPAHAQKPLPIGPTDPLTLVANGKSTPFTVEMADTPEEAQIGLMYRKEMAKDHGMIFDFGQPQNISMYMKNCFFPQDMLFLDGEGTVVAVVHNARPGSLRNISAGFPVKGVLELNGGIAKSLGVKPGDKVLHKMFKNYKPA